MAHILVGEDDKFLSKVYKTKLSKAGYEVENAMTGEQVIEMARKKKPDLILLDLIMPIKDGFQTLQELKADPKLKNVKVVILSNLRQEEDRQRVLDLGAEEYVVKANVPFAEILKLIEKYLQ